MQKWENMYWLRSKWLLSHNGNIRHCAQSALHPVGVPPSHGRHSALLGSFHWSAFVCARMPTQMSDPNSNFAFFVKIVIGSTIYDMPLVTDTALLLLHILEAVVLEISVWMWAIFCSSTMPMMLTELSQLMLQSFWTCSTMVCHFSH